MQICFKRNLRVEAKFIYLSERLMWMLFDAYPLIYVHADVSWSRGIISIYLFAYILIIETYL